MPVGFGVRVAEVRLHFVDAIDARGVVAGDDLAAQVALSQAQVRRRGGRGMVGRLARFVGGETACHHDGRVALGHRIHEVAQLKEDALQIMPCHVKGDHIRRGAARLGGQLRVEVANHRRERAAQREGDAGELRRVGRHLLQNVLGDGPDFRGWITREVYFRFGFSHGVFGVLFFALRGELR